MEGLAIQEAAIRAAEDLPGVTHEHPFGPNWDVFKVAGKVFLLVTEVRGEPIIVVKCNPEDGLALRAQHSTITPGYHMNKRHWVTVRGGDGSTSELVDELVRESYLLVLEGLPRRARPILPDDLVRAR